MGSERRKSSDRLQLRLHIPSEDRPTLIPCPACEGEGLAGPQTTTQYHMGRCKWCDGSGLVDRKIYGVFRRWLGIYHRNRMTGGCFNG